MLKEKFQEKIPKWPFFFFIVPTKPTTRSAEVWSIAPICIIVSCGFCEVWETNCRKLELLCSCWRYWPELCSCCFAFCMACETKINATEYKMNNKLSLLSSPRYDIFFVLQCILHKSLATILEGKNSHFRFISYIREFNGLILIYKFFEGRICQTLQKQFKNVLHSIADNFWASLNVGQIWTINFNIARDSKFASILSSFTINSDVSTVVFFFVRFCFYIATAVYYLAFYT